MLRLRIPTSCRTVCAELLLENDRTGEARHIEMMRRERAEDYDHFHCEFSLAEPDLYFYFFKIQTPNETFFLFRLGLHDTNMESGEKWQLSCISDAYQTPAWAQGAIWYQIFPDRFCRVGASDCHDKLTPYFFHENTQDLPEYRPDVSGKVLNNDFFGGNLRGIVDQLLYLKGLGVTVLYLNPIFMAYSSHRYDTCDYKRIDPMLGTEEDFAALCTAAHALEIRVILDGVFSHTGSDSIYFDRLGRFTEGAYSHPDSPFRSWFRFRRYPDDYEAWWGFPTLPTVNKLDQSFINYVIESEDSVVAKWLRLGADGFRLDVVDELPGAFIACLRRRVREIKKDALLIGEVWEDASNKIAYGVRRRYFIDGKLDSVMNYPWRAAILRFVRGDDSGEALRDAVEEISEHYPEAARNAMLNLISSHDVPRALTELAAPFEGTRAEMAAHVLTPAQRKWGKMLLRMAAFLQFTLPGSPCIYYGDEAGMEGCKDPFNRGFFPWGFEDAQLQAFYRSLAALRASSTALRLGMVRVLYGGGGRFSFERAYGGRRAVVHLNRSDTPIFVRGEAPVFGEKMECLADGQTKIDPFGFCVFE